MHVGQIYPEPTAITHDLHEHYRDHNIHCSTLVIAEVVIVWAKLNCFLGHINWKTKPKI